MTLINQAVLFGIAFVANGFAAVAGGGVGIIQFPLLIFLGLGFKTALATHKVATVALGVGATLRHLKESHLDRRFAAFILACGLPGVVLGSLVVLHIPDHLATLVLGVITTGMGLYSLLRPTLGLDQAARHRDRRGMAIGGAMLFGVGFLNGSIASGTGLFVTLLLAACGRWPTR